MPNHVHNKLTITGRKQDIDKFFNDVSSDEKLIDVNKIIPYPEKYKKLDEIAQEYVKNNPDDWKNRPNDGYNQGGYEWCIENWGTKWGMYDFSDLKKNKTETSCSLVFYTAWNPALPVFKKIAELYPNLKFSLRYYESGCQFSGKLKIQKGEIVEDIYNDNYTGRLGG